MNIPIHTGTPALSDFVFRAADRMRIDGCANAVAREGLSLALYCPVEALLDHYTGLLLNRLRQQAPEHSIEVYFPANTDALLGRFNEVLSSQSVNQATQNPAAALQAQIWIVHDAQKLPEGEIQLLARLIQNFPGANIRAILLMSGADASKLPLPAFGRKLLRWDIEEPTEEQAQAALELGRHEGHFSAVHQLLQRMQRQAGTALTASASEPAPSTPIKAEQLASAPAKSLKTMAVFHQQGVAGLQSALKSAKALGQAPHWIRQNARLSMGIAGAMAASTLFMLWLQPEAFGLNSLKTTPVPTPKVMTLPAASPAFTSTAAASSAKASESSQLPQAAEAPAALPAAQQPTEPAIEAPEAAMQAQAWVKSLDPNSFLIQYGTSNTYEKIIEIKRKFPELKQSQIVAAYRPGEKLAHFVLVSGPYNAVTQGYEAAKRPGIPSGSWVRSTRNLQDQLKAPASAMDTPR